LDARNEEATRIGRLVRAAALALPLLQALSLGGAAAPARAEDAPPPPVRLDRLLKLPEAVDYDMERRGGASKTEWRGRFKTAHADTVKAKKALDASMAKLEKAAVGSDQWRFVPPGGDVAAENQDNVRVRMEVERNRTDLARADKRLRDLEVEANLASVPDDWR
jgi:hypothetical protein